MTRVNNVIELNGKRFDARTGKLLGETPATIVSPEKSKLPRSHNGRVMDGVMVVTPAFIPVKPVPGAPVAHRTPHAYKPLAAHQPEHAKTLKREFVKTPTIALKQPLRGQTPVDLAKAQSGSRIPAVAVKLSSDQVDIAKIKRAEATPRSDRVIRFRRDNPQAHQNFIAPDRPTQKNATPAASRQPVVARPKTTSDLFERAIANASSHEQPSPKESGRQRARRGVRRHARRFSISTAVLVMLLLGGFVAYQNKVALEMQLAAGRAGFPASMPGYKPAGFAAKHLSYSSGSVTIGFVSSDNKSFEVIQKQSNWDSETLLQNYVADTDKPYQAYQAAGRTVYVYGSGSATWVNGGIWYQVNGNAHLSNNQIIDIATSI